MFDISNSCFALLVVSQTQSNLKNKTTDILFCKIGQRENVLFHNSSIGALE